MRALHAAFVVVWVCTRKRARACAFEEKGFSLTLMSSFGSWSDTSEEHFMSLRTTDNVLATCDVASAATTQQTTKATNRTKTLQQTACNVEHTT
jgi:hypothetical protein